MTIPLHNMPSNGPGPAVHCWVCQYGVFREQSVVLDGRIVAVHRDCWEKIPPSERIAIAASLIGRRDFDKMVAAAADVLVDLSYELKRTRDEQGGPLGLFKRPPLN